MDELTLKDVGLDEEPPSDPAEALLHFQVKWQKISALLLHAAEKKHPGIEAEMFKLIQKIEALQAELKASA